MPSLGGSQFYLVRDEISGSGRFGLPPGAPFLPQGWLAGGWGMVETRASWSRTGGVCSEARRGTLEVPPVTVYLGPGMIGREVDLASSLSR